MAFDLEELVTLTNHGTMKLRAAVARPMILPPDERKGVRIVRKGKRATLEFERIRDLAAEWETARTHSMSQAARRVIRCTLGQPTAALILPSGQSQRFLV